MNNSELIESYIPLAKSIASKYRTLDYDDRYQEAMLGLVIAADRFNPELGYFAPFARQIINNRLNSLYQKTINSPLPLSDWNSEASDRIEISDSEYLVMRLDLERSIEAMDVTSRKVARLLLRGRNQTEIGVAVGLSQPTISRIISRIRDACREVL